jgi:hypothetical protein
MTETVFPISFSMDLMVEVVIWCKENFGESVGLHSRWGYSLIDPSNRAESMFWTIWIRDEEDAMAFKLRWI